MSEKPHKTSRNGALYTGLTAALILGAGGSIILSANPPKPPFRWVSLETLDARARPYFDQARRNIPVVVAKLTSAGSIAKICTLMAQDQLLDTHKTSDYLNSVLADPIMRPCVQGAEAYGCNLHSAPFQETMRSVIGDNVEAATYATCGLALEAVFIRQTIASLRLVLGSAVAKLVSSYSTGAVCAAADGPFPFGDAVGVTLAVGGTIWCACDLYSACDRLSSDLAAALESSINDCQTACRMAVAR
ncbi:MAG: hypothetical protein MJ033_07275 [Victivallaceae bacterium]|nr:hypothetical protein [Victivallaceae bacterium]